MPAHVESLQRLPDQSVASPEWQRPLFAYLAEEIFDSLPADWQRFLLAQCYHSIGKHEQSVTLLKDFPPPPANAPPHLIASRERLDRTRPSMGCSP